MTQLRVASVVLGLLLVAPGCSSGGDEDAEAPECPPVSTDGQPAGTTTTLDPRCVQAGEERDDSDDSDESEGEGVTWEARSARRIPT
jgi:hypothetical protein